MAHLQTENENNGGTLRTAGPRECVCVRVCVCTTWKRMKRKKDRNFTTETGLTFTA